MFEDEGDIPKGDKKLTKQAWREKSSIKKTSKIKALTGEEVREKPRRIGKFEDGRRRTYDDALRVYGKDA